MNNNGRGIKKELLLAQANNVIFRLQLFTLSTRRLITLFYKLREYHSEVDELTLEENASRNPPAIIHRIHAELQSLRKCFSGSELVHWIVKNRSVLPADLSVADEEITKDIAIEIAQDLLDNHFILELESALHTETTTPTSNLDQFSPYPQLSVHSHVPSEAEDSSWEDAEGRCLRSQFYAGNNQGVRSVSDNISHTEQQAVYEEQQAEVHHTFPPLSARSSPGSMTPTDQAMSSPGIGARRMKSSSQVWSPVSSGSRDTQSPGPLGLGARYNPSPAPTTPHFSSRDQLSPGPMHHDTASERSSAEPRQRYTSSSDLFRERPSPDRTPTPHNCNADGSISQGTQDQLGCLPQQQQQQPADQHDLHKRDSDFLGSLGSRASVADFRPSADRPQPLSPKPAYGRLRRDSDNLSIDSATLFGRSDLMNGVSPFSSIADLAYLANTKFVASSKHFYFIHQSVLNPGLSLFRQRQLKEELGMRYRKRNHQRGHYRSDGNNHRDDHYQQHGDGLLESRQVRSEPPGKASTSSARRFSPEDTTATTSTDASRAREHSHHRDDRSDEDGEISVHQKNAMENLALVEQCISHKVSTDYIVAIVVGRRKTDKLAKEFFKLSVSG
ncbi:hypothetical protein ElyMa_002920400 [Elysia marginata]|uniref:DEP domain-containing protein n=1 Tax=Elysia marginata TaxID=1093978 RepID=A0AAV4I5A3_9GAST|nr:hypothetical protein ElyMa_002920400 [Elysia marginata]